MYSKASKEATMRYQKKNLDTICFRVPKGQKERYQAYAEKIGMPLSKFIVSAIEEKMERDSSTN